MREHIDIISTFLKEATTFQVFEDAATFDDWSSFSNRLKHIDPQAINSEADICTFVGLDFQMYKGVVSSAIQYWRESTSKSILNGIAYLESSFPKAGAAVFPTPEWQIRYLLMLAKTGHPYSRPSFKHQRVRGEQF